jgi:hypothetical protein
MRGMISFSTTIWLTNFETKNDTQELPPTHIPISNPQSLIYLCVTAIIKTLLMLGPNTSSELDSFSHLAHPDTFHNNKKAISPYLFAFAMDSQFSILVRALIAVYIEIGKARKVPLCTLNRSGVES